LQTALTNTSFPKFAGITIGRVYKVYPSANMVDIMMFDGSLLPKVQVMASTASTTSGKVEMPIPKYEGSDMIDKSRPYPLQDARDGESDVIAVIAFLGGSLSRPIVLGFLFPEENEILCDTKDQVGNKDGSMLLWKHWSNVYVRVAKGATEDKPADIEISHPSGLLIKIGDYDGSLTEQRTPIVNWDKDIRPFKWKNPSNNELGPVPHLFIYHPSGTHLVIDDSGNVVIQVEGNVTHTINGDLTETIDGNVIRTITGDKTETVNGDETDQVDGSWDRTSNIKIEDTAPAVHHNES